MIFLITADLSIGRNPQILDPENHIMSSKKRGPDDELVPESMASYVSTKRARTNKNHDADEILTQIKTINSEYRHPLVMDWSQPMTEQQKRFLTGMLNKGKRKSVRLEIAAGLIKSRTEKHLPRYAEKMKEPMNFSIMRNLLDTNGYASVTDLVLDFKAMISNVLSVNGGDDEASAAALLIFRTFVERMRYCPTYGQAMNRYSTAMLEILATLVTSQTTEATAQTITPSSEQSEESEVINIDDSDGSEVEDVFVHSDISTEKLQDHSFVHVSSAPSLLQNEPPHVSGSKAAKTTESGNLDDETRQLSQEIEECQQKLANMVEKKQLLSEIRDLRTEKAATKHEMHETIEQLKQIFSKAQDCHKQIDAVMEDCIATQDSQDWNDQQTERLQQERERLQREVQRCCQEIEIHRREKGRLQSIFGEHTQKIDASFSKEADKGSRPSSPRHLHSAQNQTRSTRESTSHC
jgi:hypothetical protein